MIREIATKKDVEKKATQLGATVTESYRTINVDAPTGKVWVDGSVHALCVGLYDDEPKRYAWGDLLARMSYGLEDCDESDCETCHD